ncbi:MAG: hypothetical protein JST00_15735 [Deltaproteobacteria bacterium]|nr:hypothetical protein [Deltaproteobacteria bacterium]
MGYDLLAGIAFAMLTPLVVIGFVVSWMVTAKDREEHAGFFERYARARGLDFDAAEGEWPNRTSAAVRWKSASGAEMRLSVRGREARAKTRLTIRPVQTLFGELVARPDPSTFATLEVRERPKGLADRIFDDEVRRAILGFCQRDRVVVVYRRGRFLVEWPGRELNDARLDAARRLADALALAIDEAFAATARRAA